MNIRSKKSIIGQPTRLTFVAMILWLSVPVAGQSPAPPQAVFKDLFVAVELDRIFPDSKEFADAVPKSEPSDILALYHSEKPPTPEALRRFVEEHFELPTEITPVTEMNDQLPIREHIDSLWNHLTRNSAVAVAYSSLLPLPLPYVVPGSRFREVYYWDTYFTMLGLAESGRQDLIQDLVRDFAFLIDTYAHIPNGNRSYYLSRSQPPFFFKMVGLLSPDDEAAAFAQYLPQLKKEYHHPQMAEEIACRWIVNVSRIYRQSGKLVEKYDVITPDRPGGGGEYPLQDGFGWTNGVLSKLMALYPKDSAHSDVNQCAGAN